MFSKLLCIVNISCYKIEHMKLYRSLLGVKGEGGGPKQPSEQPSLQHLTLTLKNQILVKSTTNSTNTLANVHKNIINILSLSFLKLLGGGGKFCRGVLNM